MSGGEILTSCLSAVSVLSTIAIAVFVAKVNAAQQRDSRRLEKIDTLEGELKIATTKAIDDKLATLRAEQAGPLLVINQQIAAIQRRLEFGEERFHKLEEKDHALQVEVLKALGELREVVATKQDLQRLREEMRKDL